MARNLNDLLQILENVTIMESIKYVISNPLVPPLGHYLVLEPHFSNDVVPLGPYIIHE